MQATVYVELSYDCISTGRGGRFQGNSCFVYLSHDHATQEMELMQAVFMCHRMQYCSLGIYINIHICIMLDDNI